METRRTERNFAEFVNIKKIWTIDTRTEASHNWKSEKLLTDLFDGNRKNWTNEVEESSERK